MIHRGVDFHTSPWERCAASIEAFLPRPHYHTAVAAREASGSALEHTIWRDLGLLVSAVVVVVVIVVVVVLVVIVRLLPRRMMLRLY